MTFVRKTCLLAATFLVSLAFLHPSRASDDPMWDILWEQARQQARQASGQDANPGLIPSAIDYLALRTATKARPDLLRAQLAACGSCQDRAKLERDLAIAVRDEKELNNLEVLGARIFNLTEMQAMTLGIRMRPKDVLALPEACIMLYDRYMDCQVSQKHQDKSMQLGSACYSQGNLFNLCKKGDLISVEPQPAVAGSETA